MCISLHAMVEEVWIPDPAETQLRNKDHEKGKGVSKTKSKYT